MQCNDSIVFFKIKHKLGTKSSPSFISRKCRYDTGPVFWITAKKLNGIFLWRRNSEDRIVYTGNGTIYMTPKLSKLKWSFLYFLDITYMSQRRAVCSPLLLWSSAKVGSFCGCPSIYPLSSSSIQNATQSYKLDHLHTKAILAN